MKKNIEMIVIRKYKEEPVNVSDLISNDIIYNEFKYKYIGVPIKYIFEHIYEYIQYLYSNIHIYIIYICLIILIIIFIQNHLFIKNIKINNT